MTPRISVFITSYNQKHYLVEAIESVLNQTFKAFEIIVVDDYSQDGSQELIADYASRYSNLITPIYHTHNQGIVQTRLDALQTANGDYITYLDGDDRYLPSKLEKEGQLLKETPDAQIAFSNYYYIDSDGARLRIWADREKPPQGDVFRQTFARDFPRQNLFRNELIQYRALKEVGFYDPNLCLYDLYEDWEMRIRLTKYCQVVYCDEPLTEYRIHDAGLSKAEATKHLAAVEYIHRKNLHLLNDLSVPDRRNVQRKLDKWKAKVIDRAALEALEAGRHRGGGRKQALKYLLQFVKCRPGYVPYRLILRFALPCWAYEWLRAMSRGVRGNKRLDEPLHP